MQVGATTITGLYLGSTAASRAYLGADLVWETGGGAFTPASLFASSEEGAWYDPSDLSTLWQDTAGTVPVTAAGQTVARMDDKSGNGNHATQATTASRPTYQTDGTYHWLDFDGVDDFMVTPTITPGIDKVQVFAGVRKVTDTTGLNASVIAESSVAADANNGAFFLFGRNGFAPAAKYQIGSRGTIFVLAGTNDAAFTAPTTNVVTCLGDISGDAATLRVDGTQVAQNTSNQGTGNYLAYPIYIGRRAGISLTFNGHIYSLIARFGANLDAGTIGNTETYVAGKTGVTL